MTPPTTRAIARRVAVELLDRVTHGAEEIAERLRPALPASASASPGPAPIVVRPSPPPKPEPEPAPAPPKALGWQVAQHVSTAFDLQTEALFDTGLTPEAHDPETVRRMRVASRRLRSLVQLFGPALGKKLRRRLKRPLKGITGALGPLRDADVVSAQFSSAAATKDPLRRAAAELIAARLEPGHHGLRKRAAKGVAAVDRDALRNDLREARRRIVEQLTLDADVRPLLGARLAEVCDDAFAKTPIPTTLEDREAVHDVRILAKRLRYAYGWISPAFRDGPGPRRLLKRAQRAVGNARDLELFAQRLSEHAATLHDEGQHVLADALTRWRDAVAKEREQADAKILPALANLSQRSVSRLTLDGLRLTPDELD